MSSRVGPAVGRRGFLSAMAFGASGLTVAACGAEGPGPDPAPAGGRGFPVTVPGVEGPTTIESEPRRVVSVGQYRDTDAAVALGVTPLGTPDLSTFVPGGISPWVRDRLAGPPPVLFPGTEIPFESVAALGPDLILATDRSRLPAEYARWSGLAPTLSSAGGYNKDPWQLTTVRVGQALGRSDQAAAVVAETERAVMTTRDVNPVLAGRTFTIGPVQANGSVTTINSQTDASVIFLSQLGLQLSPRVLSLGQGSFPGRAPVSPELLDVIDADITILTFNTPGARAALESQALFQSLGSVRRGSYVALDLPAALAIGFPSALSVQYALRAVVPQLAQAAR